MRQLIIFVLVLVALNAIFYLFNIDIRISIIGSILLSILVSFVMNLLTRR